MNCELCNQTLSIQQKFVEQLVEIKEKDKKFHVFCSEACHDSIDLEIEVLVDVAS